MTQKQNTASSAADQKQASTPGKSVDPIKALDAEYKKKRRELEREGKKSARAEKTATIHSGRGIVSDLRRRHKMTDEQIAKRLGLKSTAL